MSNSELIAACRHNTARAERHLSHASVEVYGAADAVIRAHEALSRAASAGAPADVVLARRAACRAAIAALDQALTSV